MKKISLFLTLVLVSLFLSTVQAAPVDSLTAKNLARDYWGGITRTPVERLKDLPVEIEYTAISEESGFANTPLVCYYIVNVGQSGFVIIAGDNRITPVLGYSTESRFETNGMPENVRYWLEGIRSEIAHALNENVLTATPKITYQWNHLAELAGAKSVVVDALIQTTWNQSKYYNQQCPADTAGPDGHVFTGCVATAMAQIIRYWEWPWSGFNSHTYTCNYGPLTVDYSSAVYNYDNMPTILDSSSTAAQIDAVAMLSSHCGVSVNMNYNPDGSAAYSYDVPSALMQYFAYPSGISFLYKEDYTAAEWDTILQNELNHSRPVYYAASSDEGGHAFICDGYDNDGTYHINWGWNGSNDGYFLIDSLTPGSHCFSNNHRAIIGIDVSGEFIRCSKNHLISVVPAGTTGEVTKVDVRGHSLSDSITIMSNGGFMVGLNDSTFVPTVSLPSQGGAFYVVYAPATTTQAQNTETVNIILTSGNVSDTVVCYGSAYEDICLSPQDVTGARHDSVVNLSWVEPYSYGNNPTSVTISQDSSDYKSRFSYGPNHTICMVHRFDVNDLAPYHNYLLKSISFMPSSEGTSFRLVVYKGGSSSGDTYNAGTQIVNQEIPISLLNRNVWNTVQLNTPVLVDANEEMWIGFIAYSIGNDGFVMLTTDSCVMGKADLFWLTEGCVNGTGNYYWYPFCEYGDFPIKGGLEQISADLVHYDVFRNNELIGITTNTDFTDENPLNITCNYSVYAVWDNDCSEGVSVTVPYGVSVPTLPTNDASLFMTLYPNPATDIVRVQLSDQMSAFSNAEIQLFDMYGKLLQSVPVTQGTTQLDFTRYASGLYFVKAVADGEVVAVQKVIRR
jgi:hypothetical protein